MHRLLSARAYLRAAVLCVALARTYIPDDVVWKDEVVAAEQLLSEALNRLNDAIGSMVYVPDEDSASPEVRRILVEVMKR